MRKIVALTITAPAGDMRAAAWELVDRPDIPASSTSATHRMEPQRTEYRRGLSIFHAQPEQPRAAILFFHGGGWVGGNPMQFCHLWPALLAEGFVCATAEYSVRKRNPRATVYRSVTDARRATESFRDSFSGLPHFLAGTSAGGTLALHSSKGVDGLILFNPVLDLSADGYKGRPVPDGGDENISPLHMKKKFPPTLILQGDRDRTTPLETAEQFPAKLIVLEGAPHGFVKLPQYKRRITNAIIRFVEHCLP